MIPVLPQDVRLSWQHAGDGLLPPVAWRSGPLRAAGLLPRERHSAAGTSHTALPTKWPFSCLNWRAG
jgi:hypothetical protein